MARTYTKKTKMTTITEYSDLLSPEEMEFFPLDLSLVECPDEVDAFQSNANTVPKIPIQEFSTEEILQELNPEGGYELFDTDWFTKKLDFNSFDLSKTLQDFSKVDVNEFESSLKDFNSIFLNEPVVEEQLTIPIEIPMTPEQKVPEFIAVSPCSVGSATSPVGMAEDSSESSPSSPCSSDSTVSLTDLINDSGNLKPLSPIQVESQSSASKRVAPYYKNTPKTVTKPKSKTPAQRQRKRVQNKDAATRYRVKKRSELEILYEEADKEEKENIKLKDQVSSISKEIEYLKNLMLEVYKTKKKRERAALLKVA